jgi:hypothetical protein
MSIRILNLATAAATTLEGSIVRRQVRLVKVRKATHQTRRGFPMRLIAFILSSAIALASIPASASAASNTFRVTSFSTTTCPVYEGYPDCHPDGAPQWSLYSSSRR